ncbi:MAG: RNA-binding S4 domain-containing protein, partial [Deltaproteobacteria bacterium]|nr:RNA-binding S4 domain-containing protein [Deltaproteobacteria bacterium]
RAKPGRVVRIGDEVKVRRGPYEWVVIVRGLGKQRGPASQAQLQYEETEASQRARAAIAMDLRAQGFRGPRPEGRPSKKARRDMLRFRRGGWK